MISGGVLPFIVFIPFVAATLALLVGRFTGLRTGWFMVLAAGTSFVLALMTASGVHDAAGIDSGSPSRIARYLAIQSNLG